jgi:hypothetical protein
MGLGYGEENEEDFSSTHNDIIAIYSVRDEYTL